MNLTNIEHAKISDIYNIQTDEGVFILEVTMNPQTETEPVMRVTNADGSGVDEIMEDTIIEMFLSVGKNEIENQ